MIISCVVSILPVLFDFTDSIPMLQKMQEVCPIFMLHINGVFAVRKTYAGIMQPIIMLVFNLGIGVVFYVLIKRTFRRHQVIG